MVGCGWRWVGYRVCCLYEYFRAVGVGVLGGMVTVASSGWKNSLFLSKTYRTVLVIIVMA